MVLKIYSLRNGPSYSSQNLLCWYLEGSNDGVNWTAIDTRDYRETGDPQVDANTKEARDLLF